MKMKMKMIWYLSLLCWPLQLLPEDFQQDHHIKWSLHIKYLSHISCQTRHEWTALTCLWWVTLIYTLKHVILGTVFSFHVTGQNLKCFTNFSEAAESQSDVKKSFLAIFVWSSCRPLLLGAPTLQYPRDCRHCLQAWSSFCHNQAFTEAPPLSTWKEAQLGHEILTGNNIEAKFAWLQMLILSNLAALHGYVFLWGKSVGAHVVIFMKMMQIIKKSENKIMYRTNIHIVFMFGKSYWESTSTLIYLYAHYSQKAMTSQCPKGIVGMRNCTWWQLRMQS